MGKTIYVLDFDGVVCDSRLECMVTSYIAYQRLYNQELVRTFSHDNIKENWKTKFFQYRFLARIAREYKLLWDLITLEHPISSSQSLYKQTRSEPDELIRFHELFYSTRKRWIEKDIGSWIKNNPLYREIIPYIEKWYAKNQLLIASAKDRNSIRMILEFAGIPVSDDIIYGNEEGDKPDHFADICLQNPDSDIIFIDDNLENLLLVKKKIKLNLAIWGYNCEEDIKYAREAGINILTLQDISSLE